MIKFIQKEEIKKVKTFGEVEHNQFFVNGNGHFCQKTNDSEYSIIADKHNNPHADYMQKVSPRIIIRKILPHTSKIEFL